MTQRWRAARVKRYGGRAVAIIRDVQTGEEVRVFWRLGRWRYFDAIQGERIVSDKALAACARRLIGRDASAEQLHDQEVDGMPKAKAAPKAKPKRDGMTVMEAVLSVVGKKRSPVSATAVVEEITTNKLAPGLSGAHARSTIGAHLAKAVREGKLKRPERGMYVASNGGGKPAAKPKAKPAAKRKPAKKKAAKSAPKPNELAKLAGKLGD